MAKGQILITVVEDVEKLEPHILLMEMEDGSATLENSLAVAQSIRELGLSNSIPRNITKKMKINVHTLTHIQV